ncbi:MAG: penicillin-binding protein 1A [Pseudomonadota bacterium]|nr:MAG: penicillin-binding protein [Pseudomonadota bacterium]
MKYLRWVGIPLAVLAGLAVLGALLIAFVVLLAYPKLPSVEVLADYRPKVPLRVYTADGVLIGEFGEERRAFVRIGDVPEVMKQAIIAAEDERFYTHRGVDYVGVIRAAYSNLVTGGKRQGASTITMQVARNFFLSSEKTWTRKLYEALLAFKIESTLSKDQILEIYLNQIYLGQRAYGFAAAAQTYFGKALKDVTLAEAAMLAGMPKAPSSYNPVVNFSRAKQRQLYVLRRMHELGFIDDEQLAQAQTQKLTIVREVADTSQTDAQYLAEMVRQVLYERYPEDVYTAGFRVYTTVHSKDQEAAVAALREGLLEYDRRHGYRGPEAYVELPANAGEDVLDEVLHPYADSGDLLAAVVLDASAKQVKAYRRGGETVTISGEGLRFAQSMLSAQAPPNKKIRRGAIVRIRKDAKGRWQLLQLPAAEAAFIALDPQTGAVRALVGGFDFWRNKYNHVTQAWRQPGSAFKPFIYSAALEKGFTPATIINDAPVVVDANMTGGQVWEPKNYDGKYEGPIRMRTALAKSKNMVSIRLLQAIGPQYAQDYIRRFGFTPERHPPYLTMALGAGSVTPWQMAQAYTVFANGGYRVEPYFIEKIVDDRGNVLAQAEPRRAGDESLRVIDRRNAFVMHTMLQEVVRTGTAVRAMQLGRLDLAGKTGTTNDNVDAWFAGYQPNLVGVAWVGFDQPRKLGTNETGAVAALPIWIDFMRSALKDIPPADLVMPEGVVAVSIDPETGLRDPAGTLTEYFYEENVPPLKQTPPPEQPGSRTIEEVLDQLF